jgi:Ca-activated chloride channel family protein
VLIDTSASMAENMTLARAAAKRIGAHAASHGRGPGHAVQRARGVLQDFTPEVAALESAIDKTRASGDTALHTAIYIALKDLARRGRGELQRRAIVLLSDGEDTVSTITDDQVLELARRSEISVYAISLGRPGPAALPRTTPGATCIS